MDKQTYNAADNTLVTGSDMNYLWGVFLAIASMRRVGMNEPAIVFGKDYTSEAKKILAQLGNIEVVDAPPSGRSMTCRKPEAMLCAKTKFVTWIDGDAFFTDNCSPLLPPTDPDKIHIRKRGIPEVTGTKLAELDDLGKTIIARFMSDQWRMDVGELDAPRLDTCCSACYLSLSDKHRGFLERWRAQVDKVLPDDNVGVVDKRKMAYFQTDESVLNSLLCYMRDAPVVTDNFALNKPPHYIHFISKPKPWVAWTPHSMGFYEQYMKVVDFVLEQKFELPTPLPFALVRKNKKLCRAAMPLVWLKYKARGAIGKIKNRS